MNIQYFSKLQCRLHVMRGVLIYIEMIGHDLKRYQIADIGKKS